MGETMPGNPSQPPKEARYAFYEKVRIISDKPPLAEFNGRLAAVLGKAQDDEGHWSYAVHIYGETYSWSCNEGDLEPTGEFDCRETFYSGESIRVSKDGKLLGWTGPE